MTMSIETNLGIEHLGFFSERLLHGMATRKLPAKKLAPRVGCSYEFVRRMVRSESLPSPGLMMRMCSVFLWKPKEIEELIRVDRCRRKFGTTFWSVLGINPRMEPVYILFPYLTDDEKQLIVDMLRAYLAAKEANKDGSGQK